jgi:hypothetical protein
MQPHQSASELLAELAFESEGWREIVLNHEAWVLSTVAVLRAADASWADIADALGISKQAAWEKFG